MSHLPYSDALSKLC